MTQIRQLVPLLGLMLAFAAWDFVSRIYVARDDTLRNFEPPGVTDFAPRPDSLAIRQQLVSWMPGLAGTAGVAAQPSDPSGWDLSLAGVFRQGDERFALLLARPRGGAGAELHQARKGDEVHGSMVQDIESRLVRLKRGEDVQELRLFEPGKAKDTAKGAAPATGAPIPARAWSPGPGGGSSSVEAIRAQKRARQPQDPAPRAIPRPLPRSGDPSGSPPGAGEGHSQVDPPTVPGATAVAEPGELGPGEELKLPADLPVVEANPSSREKRP